MQATTIVTLSGKKATLVGTLHTAKETTVTNVELTCSRTPHPTPLSGSNLAPETKTASSLGLTLTPIGPSQ